jgi:hypothetical protein
MAFISEEHRQFIKGEKCKKFRQGEFWEVRNLALADASTRLSLPRRYPDPAPANLSGSRIGPDHAVLCGLPC